MQTVQNLAFLNQKIFSLSVEHVDPDPTSFSQVIKSSSWCHAVEKEFNAFLENDTWKLVPRTPSMNVVGHK